MLNRAAAPNLELSGHAQLCAGQVTIPAHSCKDVPLAKAVYRQLCQPRSVVRLWQPDGCALLAYRQALVQRGILATIPGMHAPLRKVMPSSHSPTVSSVTDAAACRQPVLSYLPCCPCRQGSPCWKAQPSGRWPTEPSQCGHPPGTAARSHCDGCPCVWTPRYSACRGRHGALIAQPAHPGRLSNPPAVAVWLQCSAKRRPKKQVTLNYLDPGPEARKSCKMRIALTNWMRLLSTWREGMLQAAGRCHLCSDACTAAMLGRLPRLTAGNR